MRRWVLYCAVFVAAAIFRFPGFYGTDVGKLLPVEAVRVSIENGQILLETDTADTGYGLDVEAALQNLKETTVGNVFLETADYLIIQPGCENLLTELQKHLRPSCGICMETQRINPEKAAVYLRVHEPQLTLGQWQGGKGRIPVLNVEGEKLKLVP